MDVTLDPWVDLIQVFQLQAPVLPEGRAAIKSIGAFVIAKVAAAPTPTWD